MTEFSYRVAVPPAAAAQRDKQGVPGVVAKSGGGSRSESPLGLTTSSTTAATPTSIPLRVVGGTSTAAATPDPLESTVLPAVTDRWLAVGAGPAISHGSLNGTTAPCVPCLGGTAKRVADIVLAAIALVLAAPLMLIIAAAIRLTMGGPVLFAHERIGWRGRPFKCLKFRTMVADGDRVLARYLAANPSAAREWRETCKLATDPRITPLGQILRRSSLDELPQLVNILRGDMSCVGPRPVVRSEIDRYGERKAEYLMARPGLTGLWQCSGRSSLSYADRVTLDARYARDWSMLLDAHIILRTVPALLRYRESA